MRWRPALWTAIGFAVGLVLGREVEAAPFFCSQVFFGWSGVLSLSLVFGWQPWRGVCPLAGLTRRTKGLFYVRRSRPPPAG